MHSYSSDQLSKLTEEDLKNEYLSVRSKINLEKKFNNNTIDLEIYFCYVSREIQERATRRRIIKSRVAEK